MTLRDGDRLAELLCSRLCHDLISPLGAITNGVELLAEGHQDVMADAMSLIGASARQGAARLTYFRLAFGAGAGEQGVGFGIIRKAILDHFDERKLALTWAEPVPADQAVIDRSLSKLILNLMLVAGECAQRDAGIVAAISLGSSARITVSVRGGRCKLREDVRTGFEPDLADDALTVRNVIARQCRRLAGSLGLELTVVDEGQNSVDFTAA